jgi:asparagine synthase (glutamine-hydrolysing)
MCGIFGLVHNSSPTSAPSSPHDRERLIAHGLGLMVHRGPDEHGMTEQPLPGGSALLGHNRLSIVDVGSGRQPFVDERHGVRVVCNGEIYNHAELRRRLFGDYPFWTRSDCEVLLPTHLRYRGRTAGHLDGMFAYLVADRRGFVAARDPLGIKPLYYGAHPEGTLFSSEAKALDGLVEEIHAFPRGHFYESGVGFCPYYEVPDPDEGAWVSDEAEALGMIRRGLERSVRKRLMSDVPVGVFLSGGLDSSLVAALARPHVEELSTFAVGMEGSPDLAAAREVAEFLGTTHREVVFDEADVRAALPDILYHLESWDPALVHSAIPNWFVARLAGEGRGRGPYCKVILTGEGADELFAGYKYLAGFDDPHALQTELRRLLGGLHHLNLQRVDRMTMAHALEARVPFLDVGFIATALRIHPRLKLHAAYGREKGLLRKAFAGLLPDHILYRTKTEFGQGSTVGAWLRRLAAEEVKEVGASGEEDRETVLYRRMFEKAFRTPFAAGALGAWQGPVL